MPGLKTDLIKICGERDQACISCVRTCACLVFIGWQASPEQGTQQHEDKWYRIERVPARPYNLHLES